MRQLFAKTIPIRPGVPTLRYSRLFGGGGIGLNAIKPFFSFSLLETLLGRYGLVMVKAESICPQASRRFRHYVV